MDTSESVQGHDLTQSWPPTIKKRLNELTMLVPVIIFNPVKGQMTVPALYFLPTITNFGSSLKFFNDHSTMLVSVIHLLTNQLTMLVPFQYLFYWSFNKASSSFIFLFRDGESHTSKWVATTWKRASQWLQWSPFCSEGCKQYLSCKL